MNQQIKPELGPICECGHSETGHASHISNQAGEIVKQDPRGECLWCEAQCKRFRMKNVTPK
jgi:hypothetical protein